MVGNADAAQALARGNIYGLLARITRAEVDASLLGAFRQPGVLEALREAGADLAPALAGADDGALLEELATAYAYLFLLNLSPHESVQRGEGRLWGDRTVAAGAFLEEAGLAVEGETSLLPDHISLELAVMQRLSADEAARLSAGDETGAEALRSLQKRYLKEHLGAWGVKFFGDAERAANHEFYRQLSRLAREFLHSDLVFFGLA
ncbi:MAG TPA: molecular chaperone TorD family protein [Symbiobacteriaceae bacterium]|nr:molecular chaperone TorD family protein [Symbiobacteriaceae bacterium]